jgi:hypothetical protein
MTAVRRVRLEVTLGSAMQTLLAHQTRHAPMTHGMTLGT